MTTYNTRNPIGSTAVKDLYDNAENLDVLVNDKSKLSHPDRLGVDRKTYHGMEWEFDSDQVVRENEFDSAQAYRESRFNMLIASSGYQFLGDYEAGIEITEYNQVVRGSDGEFWRLSGQVGLPYTTTGVGLPENDALTPLGDAVLRQQLAGDVANGLGAQLVRGSVMYIDTFTGLQTINTSSLIIGQQVSVGEAGMFVWSGTDWLPKNNETITVKIPSDYPTLQEAVDALSNFKPAQGAIIDLLIESGHRPVAGLFVRDGDYSHFRISSQDSEVLLSDDFPDAYFLKADFARAPVLNAFIDCNRLPETAVDIQNGSFIKINPRCGVANPGRRGIYITNSSEGIIHGCLSIGAATVGTGRNLWVARNSRCSCTGATFDGAADYNVWVSRSSNVYGDNVTLRNARTAVGATRFSVATFIVSTIDNVVRGAAALHADLVLHDTSIEASGSGVEVSEAGRLTARNIIVSSVGSETTTGILVTEGSTASIRVSKISGFKFSGIACSNSSRVSGSYSLITNCSTGVDARYNSHVDLLHANVEQCNNGIRARDSSIITLTQGSITDSSDRGAYAETTSRINVSFSTVSGSGEQDLRVTRGSTIAANNTVTTNGSPSLADVNVNSFNAWQPEGIIYS